VLAHVIEELSKPSETVTRRTEPWKARRSEGLYLLRKTSIDQRLYMQTVRTLDCYRAGTQKLSFDGGRGNQRMTMSAHDRLLNAATQAVARDGYVNLTVERILAAASVSRATFYQYFSNVDDCFWSAYCRHAEQLVSDVAAAAQANRHPELAVLDALAAAATSRPEIACLLMRECLAAGPRGLVERDRLISQIEQAMSGPVPSQPTIDLPVPILIGATFRFLSMRLSDGGALDGVEGEVREWVESFARRSSRPSWSARFAPVLPREAPPMSVQLSPRRPADTPRKRILRATAASMRAKSYRAVTVADIAAVAGVSRRAFYTLFQSKADVFIAAYEHAFQQALAAFTPAFFTPRKWPERIWHGALAFTSFFASEPLFAYLGFVECYAIGPGFASRVHDTQLAFTLFLEDGYQQRPEAQSPSRASSALTATAIFELGFQASRRSPSVYLRPMQPLAVFIALAPFIGANDAGEFVMAKLSATDADAPASA
jgi:AcrR family transcriptional regulator